MKKTLTLCAALCCSVLAATAADFRVDDLSYTIIDNVNHYVALDTTHSPTGITELTIPSTVVYNSTTYTVTQTAENCFKFGSLTKLTIPSTIDSLKYYFCGEQTGIEEVNFSEGLVYIGDQAFRKLQKVERLTFPNSLKKIDEFAFIVATGLKHVTFGTGIERIAYFYKNNTTLESITIQAITPPTIFYENISITTFGASAYTNAVLYVPASAEQTVLAAYSAAYGWKNFTDIREITETPSGVSSVKSGNLTTWHAEGSIFVENTEAMSQVEVIDLQGRTVRVQKGNGHLFVLPYAENGGYILRVTNTAGQVSSIKGLCRN